MMKNPNGQDIKQLSMSPSINLAAHKKSNERIQIEGVNMFGKQDNYNNNDIVGNTSTHYLEIEGALYPPDNHYFDNEVH